jgi:predicted RNase H-like nuclease
VRTVGLDATRGGWVAVTLVGGALDGVAVVRSAPEALERWPDALAYGVDIPIGLLDEPRHADVAARAALGRRGSTVFATPCASAIAQPTYAAANRVHRERVGSGLSAQAYALRERIVDAARIAGDRRVHEVHPELVFARLAGGPLAPKRSWNGLFARRRLLAAAGIELPDALAGGEAPPDDVLDAAAVALAAWDVLHGRSPSYPADPTQRDADGRGICIRG